MMSQSASTFGQNQQAAPPLSVKRKVFTLAQEQLAREFTETYNIKREQISFEGEGLDPIFDYDALSLLALQLSDIPKIAVVPGDYNPAIGLVTAICTVTLVDGRSRETYANAMVGEVLHDGTPVEDFSHAMNMARSRALRIGLRSVGFDVVRVHYQARKEDGQSTKAQTTDFVDLKNKELGEIHMLGEELGYLVEGDTTKAAWKNLIGTYFAGKTSSGDLSDLQRSQFLAMLRGWKSARIRGEDNSLATALLSNKRGD